ncbi:MAG: biotin carboxylase N-terminal domain-containing protein [Parvularcula sp.]|nr:biotin carboxylase N-terminal domain-containing protein [Parvularcula sp.]
MSRRFDTLLVANRGEIALRILRTAKDLGYRTVAVASEADLAAPHARFADVCIPIGPAPAAKSYLDMEAIIRAARASGANAIHPGYGFLSENATFAQRVLDEGFVFVGPSPRAIALMGDKAAAKRAMIAAGVPCIPGYEGEDQTDAPFVAAAQDAGFPVMVKAAAGGGGRGMRKVLHPQELTAALSDARAEAKNAFGSAALILEKAVENARHIEIQIFGDETGRVISLGERDCSLQRRHQKVIEEAPSPAVTPHIRERMNEAAIAAAQAVDYVGAGTVEFLLAEDGAFYFLEMNTRLQVEHPVTEEVTGLDLVALQLAVAQGEALPSSSPELQGHAIEARLYAEDVPAGFLPSTGPVLGWFPAEDVRVDGGISTGSEISSHYDPMVAKIIARGSDREEARRKLIRALEETHLFGPTTNRLYLRALLRGDAFAAGEALTTTIDNQEPPPSDPPPVRHFVIAAVIQDRAAAQNHTRSLPQALRDWSPGLVLERSYRYKDVSGETELHISGGPRRLAVRTSESSFTVDVEQWGDSSCSLSIGEERYDLRYVIAEETVHFGGRDFEAAMQNLNALRQSDDVEGGEGAVTAAMHGQVTAVFIEEGERVERGQRLALLEAMKMQHAVTAPISGVLARLAVSAGTQVAGGDLIALIEPDTE